MSTHFRKDCDYCGDPIRMAQMNNGQWLAFDVGGGKHDCQANSEPSSVSSNVSSRNALTNTSVVGEPSREAKTRRSAITTVCEPDWDDRQLEVAHGGTLSAWLMRWWWLVLVLLILIAKFSDWLRSLWPW